MNYPTKSKTRATIPTRPIALLVLCLVAILAFLFKDSFKAQDVLFANDGPLGVLKSAGMRVPGVLTGFWMDLNWVGMNGSTAPFSVTYLILWLLGPIGFAKFYGPITLLLLGLCAWTFFRTLKLSTGLCIVASLAAALNMNFFSNTCWGLGTRSLTLAAVFLALAALNTHRLGNRWINAALAGLAVGVGVIEGADNGVIFSFFVAAYVLFQSLVENKTVREKVISATRVGIVALFAGFIAIQVLIPLIGIASKGATSIEAPAEKKTPAEEWGFATQWSLPPSETLRVIVPGLYGYRMDTPEGGEYWGRVGELPAAPEAFRRSSGAGEYAGVLVVLVGLWALFQSFRPGSTGVSPVQPSRTGVSPVPSTSSSIFTDLERKYIWFWAGAALIAVLLSWGRHAPFYHLIYPLPFFKSIRNPMKFMHPGHLCLMVLFAYGLLGLSRRYLEAASNAVKRPASLFEKRWAIGSIAAFVLSLAAFGVYASSRGKLVQHLEAIGYPDPAHAAAIANFSIGEVGMFVVFLLISVVAILLIQFGVFTGAKSKWAALLLGVVVTVDLARADKPWIIHYDYQDQYASNPILDVLRDKPWEHRVTAFPEAMMPNQLLHTLNQVYFGVWIQHQFQFYNIQSLDMSQEPRPPADKQAYLKAVGQRRTRLWELTNVRYILGLSAGFADALNQQLDPVQKRFKERTAFDFLQSAAIGAQVTTNGHWALIEFTGALPRAQVYSQWQVGTNIESTLAKLADPAFDPHQTVLLQDSITIQPSNDATNQRPGTVEFASYSPKQIELNVNASTPSVLLLNDKYDPDWKVWVDGKPAKLLRCNYLMRGVQVPAGASKVRFHFEPSLFGLKITLTAIAVGAVLCVLLFMVRPRGPEPEGAYSLPTPEGQSDKNPSRQRAVEERQKVKSPRGG